MLVFPCGGREAVRLSPPFCPPPPFLAAVVGGGSDARRDGDSSSGREDRKGATQFVDFPAIISLEDPQQFDSNLLTNQQLKSCETRSSWFTREEFIFTSGPGLFIGLPTAKFPHDVHLQDRVIRGIPEAATPTNQGRVVGAAAARGSSTSMLKHSTPHRAVP